jgi:hypothetical protein
VKKRPLRWRCWRAQQIKIPLRSPARASSARAFSPPCQDKPHGENARQRPTSREIFDTFNAGMPKTRISRPAANALLHLRRLLRLARKFMFQKFPPHAIGEKIPCPHCNMDITLKELA